MENIKNYLFDMSNVLKEKGYKNTPARMAILEIFYKNKLPLTANEIYTKLLKEKKIKDINEATVYRTLSSFEKAEILKKIDLRKDSAYFELNNDHHHHIICTKCGMIEDFKESFEIESLLKKIVNKSSKFRKIKEHSLELFGVCRVCN